MEEFRLSDTKEIYSVGNLNKNESRKFILVSYLSFGIGRYLNIQKPQKDVWFKIVSTVVCLSSRSQDLLRLNECPVF